MATPKTDQLGKKETERRRDEALKRALNTPPKPHKPPPKPNASKGGKSEK